MIMSFIVIFSVIAVPSSVRSDVPMAPRYRYHNTSLASHLDLEGLTCTSLMANLPKSKRPSFRGTKSLMYGTGPSTHCSIIRLNGPRRPGTLPRLNQKWGRNEYGHD